MHTKVLGRLSSPVPPRRSRWTKTGSVCSTNAPRVRCGCIWPGRPATRRRPAAHSAHAATCVRNSCSHALGHRPARTTAATSRSRWHSGNIRRPLVTGPRGRAALTALGQVGPVLAGVAGTWSAPVAGAVLDVLRRWPGREWTCHHAARACWPRRACCSCWCWRPRRRISGWPTSRPACSIRVWPCTSTDGPGRIEDAGR